MTFAESLTADDRAHVEDLVAHALDEEGRTATAKLLRIHDRLEQENRELKESLEYANQCALERSERD